MPRTSLTRSKSVKSDCFYVRQQRLTLNFMVDVIYPLMYIVKRGISHKSSLLQINRKWNTKKMSFNGGKMSLVKNVFYSFNVCVCMSDFILKSYDNNILFNVL